MSGLEELQERRDRCASDLKKLKQAVKGMETKVAKMEAQLEIAEEMLAIAKRSNPEPDK
jgi:hypothetical protein